MAIYAKISSRAARCRQEHFAARGVLLVAGLMALLTCVPHSWSITQPLKGDHEHFKNSTGAIT